MHLVKNDVTPLFKNLGSVRLKKEYFYSARIHLNVKKDIKDFTLLKKISISNKSCSFELSIHFRIN